MPVYDLSGVIREGIWRYGDAYPQFKPEHTGSIPGSCFFEIFHGFHSQTGTYLETTAHLNEYEGHRLICDVDVSALVDIPCRVLHAKRAPDGSIDARALETAADGMDFPAGCAILFESVWDNWYAPDFLTGAPYLTRDAMEWLLIRKPSLIGSDTPAWQRDEPVFDLFAATDTLLLAPLVNLGNVKGRNARLTVLPLRIADTCCAPARAVLTEE